MNKEKYLNKDKVIDDLLLLVAKKNKRIAELETENEKLRATGEHKMRHPQLNNNPFVRYKFGRTPFVKPPSVSDLPGPIPTTSIISEQAQRAGATERRRIRGRRGRAGTIFAGRRDLAPALVSKAGLKTTFG